MSKSRLMICVAMSIAFGLATYFAGPIWGAFAAVICFVAIYAGVVIWYRLEGALDRALGKTFYDPSKHEE